MLKLKDGMGTLVGTNYEGSSDYLLLADGTTKKVSDFVKTSTLSNYVTLNTEQTITGSKTFSDIVIPQGKFIFGKSESNGSMLHFDGARTVIGSAGASTSKATHIRSKTGHATVGDATGSKLYTVLDSGNSSVSGRTININGTSTTWTNDGGDANKLQGYGRDSFVHYRSWDSSPGQDADKMTDNRVNFSYANNCPNVGALITFSPSGYCLQFSSQYTGNILSYRSRNGDNGTWNNWNKIWTDKTLTKLSQLTNDKGYITGYTNNYLTNVTGTCGGNITFKVQGKSDIVWNSSHSHSQYLTSHQSLTNCFQYKGDGVGHTGDSLWDKIGSKAYHGGLPDGLTGAYTYGQVLTFPAGSARFEIYCSHTSSSGNGLYYRSGWNAGKQPWVKFWDTTTLTKVSQLTNDSGYISSLTSTSTTANYTSNIFFTVQNTTNKLAYSSNLKFNPFYSKLYVGDLAIQGYSGNPLIQIGQNYIQQSGTALVLGKASGNLWLNADGNSEFKGNLTAPGFHHSSKNDDNYVLLAGGGYKALSTLASFEEHSYTDGRPNQGIPPKYKILIVKLNKVLIVSGWINVYYDLNVTTDFTVPYTDYEIDVPFYVGVKRSPEVWKSDWIWIERFTYNKSTLSWQLVHRTGDAPRFSGSVGIVNFNFTVTWEF